jgi:superfamily I DNA/RNA helicase
MINVWALNGIPASSSPTKNLNTLNEEELKSLLVYLSLFKKESDELQLWELQLHWFNLSDYISDIKSKLDEIKYKYKIKQLKEMEDKLEKLLSDDKRKELELDSLNDLLKSM